MLRASVRWSMPGVLRTVCSAPYCTGVTPCAFGLVQEDRDRDLVQAADVVAGQGLEVDRPLRGRARLCFLIVSRCSP